MEGCAIQYSYTVAFPEGLENAVTFDAQSREFTIENQSSLGLSGTDSNTYTITVTAKTGSSTVVEKTAEFNLKVKNPCLNDSFVTITCTPPELSHFTYVLSDPAIQA